MKMSFELVKRNYKNAMKALEIFPLLKDYHLNGNNDMEHWDLIVKANLALTSHFVHEALVLSSDKDVLFGKRTVTFEEITKKVNDICNKNKKIFNKKDDYDAYNAVAYIQTGWKKVSEKDFKKRLEIGEFMDFYDYDHEFYPLDEIKPFIFNYYLKNNLKGNDIDGDINFDNEFYSQELILPDPALIQLNIERELERKKFLTEITKIIIPFILESKKTNPSYDNNIFWGELRQIIQKELPLFGK